jgi:hypothetical protein
MDVALEAPVAALLAWTRAHPAYRYTVDATEYGGGVVQRTTMEVSYDARVPVQVVRVIEGSGRGTVVTWRGGDRVSVRPGGILHAITVSMNIRDARILSLRGNDVRTAIFSRVADCVAAHAETVHIERGPASTVITIRDPGGIHCGEEDGDRMVTVDRVTVALDERPIRRERFAGETLLERWEMRDVRTLP